MRKNKVNLGVCVGVCMCIYVCVFIYGYVGIQMYAHVYTCED